MNAANVVIPIPNGKANAIAAVAGKRAIMELGSISRTGSERLFLMSTTHGPELASLSAMIHVVSRLRKSTDLQHISEYGTEMILRLNEVSASHGLEGNLIFYGNPASPYFKVLDNHGAPSLALRTVLAQELINNGVMMPWIALCSAHDQKEMRVTVRALDEAAKILARAVNSDASEYLVGDPIKPVFRRYN